MVYAHSAEIEKLCFCYMLIKIVILLTFNVQYNQAKVKYFNLFNW